MEEMDEKSVGTIREAFCYIREQDPRMKTDYEVPIKYDNLAPPDEVLKMLFQIHQAIAMNRFDETCALCFSLEVGEECYVCACRIRTIKPRGERQYQMLKAFIVTRPDLDRFGTGALSIGTKVDWATLERDKPSTMPVNIRTLSTELAIQRYVDGYTQILLGEAAPGTVPWPVEQLTYESVMQNVRLALQKLPAKQRSRKNIVIGLPKEVTLPVSLDLSINQNPKPSKKPVVQTVTIQTIHPIDALIADLGKFGEAVKILKIDSADPACSWRGRLWNTVQEITTDIQMGIHERGIRNFSSSKGHIKHIRTCLFRLRMECMRSGYWSELEKPFQDLDRDICSINQGSPKERSDQSQSTPMRFDSNTKWWIAAGVVVCVIVFVLFGPMKSIFLGAGEDPHQKPSKSGQGSNDGSSNGSTSGVSNSGTSDGSNGDSSPKANELSSLVANYSVPALRNLFPHDIDPKVREKLQHLYDDLDKKQKGKQDPEKHNLRSAAYNNIANTLSQDEQDWLTAKRTLLKRLAFTPEQWAKLGPHDRLTDDEWGSVENLVSARPTAEGNGDTEFKKELGKILTDNQCKVVGITKVQP